MATKKVPAVLTTAPPAVQKKEYPIVNWKQRLAEKTAAAVEQEASVQTGAFINTRAGQLVWQGNVMPDNKMKVVVLDSILENAYYEGQFDADNPVPPVCYAFGHNEKEMAPRDDVPEKQNDQCLGCQWNEFGTSATGKGRACKNIRRLALIPANNLTLNNLEKSEVAFLKVPVTSVKAWAAYVRTLSATRAVPPIGAITEISCTPDAKTQFKLSFSAVDFVDDDLMGALLNKADATVLDFPYPDMPEQVMKPVPRNTTRAASRPSGPQKAATATRRKF